MRFADYFGRAFASVGSAQFPWMKMLKESTVAKMVDVSSEIPPFVFLIINQYLNSEFLFDCLTLEFLQNI